MRSIIPLTVFVAIPILVFAQQGAAVADFFFHPDSRLPGRAANYPGGRIETPASRFDVVDDTGSPLLFYGQSPVERRLRLAGPARLPGGPFTIETWVLMHVNRPVGMLAAARGRRPGAAPDWSFGFFGNRLAFGLRAAGTDTLSLIEAPPDRGWKRYWLHLVGSYDGQTARLYCNGTLKGERHIGPRAVLPAFLELAAYTGNEPYMELAHLLKRCRLYDYALDETAIRWRLDELSALVERGQLFPGLFHFTAGPYLHYVTPTSVNLSWETDRPDARATVRYGTRLPMNESVDAGAADHPEIHDPHHIRALTLDGLRPATPYFYEVELIDAAGDTLRSGVLTFATAPATEAPFSFAVLGDTEARPHVNFRLSQLIWDERPDFLLLLGDLTDGGQQAHKFEWTHEYFTGMTALTSRIPVFPVAGNGESDLYWYRRYHKLPDPEEYYTFRYGNAEFFMLNSNRAATGFAPGGEQYAWLEEQLRGSTATWKFVCHHHAPYSSDEDDYGDSWQGPSDLGDRRVRQIVPLYEKYGVDVVFFGHLHTYQRTLPARENGVNARNGVVYIQGGGGGGNLEDFAPTRSWFSGKTYRGHHYITVGVAGDELHLRMYDAEGRLKDFVTLNK